MRCENKFCVYYRKGSCLLNEITLNEIGLCMDCISVEINEDELTVKREKGRELMELKYGKNEIFEKIRSRRVQEILRKRKEEREKSQ